MFYGYNQKIRIGIIALGLFIIGLSIYLSYLVPSYSTILGIVTIAGIATAGLGYRYKPEDKTIKRPKVKIASLPLMVSLMGMVIFFVGLAFGYVAMFDHYNPLSVTLFATLFLIGLVIFFVGRLLTKFGEKKGLKSYEIP